VSFIIVTMSGPVELSVPISWLQDSYDPSLGKGLRFHFQASDPKEQVVRQAVRHQLADHDILADAAGPIRPDISFMPDFAVYQNRVASVAKQRAAPPSADDSLPTGFLKRIQGPRVWSSAKTVDATKLESADSFVLKLEKEHISEIEAALEHFKGEKPLNI
jgi:hypothetical protein